MGRLPGFDYKRPFFYMATITRMREPPLQHLHPFSAISPDGRIVPNAITEAFEKEIAALPQQWPYVESLSPHVIMPDHLHLMVKLGRPGAAPAALGTVIAQLKKRLREAYWGVVGGAAGAALQDQGFARAAPAASRGTRDWLLAAAERIGPGGAGVSTFLSPLEKEAAATIEKAGGARIVLSMEGFPERWHPGREEERLCADGRLLFLSPYQPQAVRLTRNEMFHRAHNLVDWALSHSSFQLEAWP